MSQCSGTKLAHVRLLLTSSLSPAEVLQIYLCPSRVSGKVVPESRLLPFPLCWVVEKRSAEVLLPSFLALKTVAALHQIPF